MATKDKHSKKRKNFFVYCIVIAMVFLISSVFFGFIPAEYRATIALAVLTIIILPSVLNMIFKKVKTTVTALLTLVTLCISSCVTLAKPDFSITNLLLDKETTEPVSIHDNDFIKTSDESDAIESIAEDIDNSVFEKFYQFSYIRNGQINGSDAVPEEMKLESITDMIVSNIERHGLERTQYSDAELNSGKYSDLTREANKAEETYKKEKETRDSQSNIFLIESFLQKRIEAYSDKKTSELARLIGNTYAELASHQVVNNNIVSNCAAIKYYIESCQLSDPTKKCDIFYEIGIRFNCISEIAREVYIRENSIEYKQLFIDSLYMSIAYYKLYRDGFIEDYKNNYYLARNYKLLGETVPDNANKISYFEKAINILHTLEHYDELSPKSRNSICKLLYNTLNAYKNVPDIYWHKYTAISLDDEICDKQREKTLYKE